MDQSFFNWVFGFAGAAGGWVLKIIWDAIVELKQDVKSMDANMHKDFVRRDDFKDAILEIKSDMKDGFKTINNSLGLIYTRLEAKEDKE